MFFVLSKTLAILLEPLLHPFLLLGLAAVCNWRRRRRLVRLCLGAAIILPLLYGAIPLSGLPLNHLENRFPIPDLASTSEIDGIIVLGGHTSRAQVSESRQQPQQNDRAERLTIGLSLHNQFPDALLLFSGFSGNLRSQGWDEAQTTTALLSALGISRDNILFESTSRNTYENAVNSKSVLVPQPGSRWLLVTSANHMPRAVGAFRKVGWTGIIPYPVDYQTPITPTARYDLEDGFIFVRTSLYEYVGLLIYRLTGRGDALLPAPANAS